MIKIRKLFVIFTLFLAFLVSFLSKDSIAINFSVEQDLLLASLLILTLLISHKSKALSILSLILLIILAILEVSYARELLIASFLLDLLSFILWDTSIGVVIVEEG